MTRVALPTAFVFAACLSACGSDSYTPAPEPPIDPVLQAFLVATYGPNASAARLPDWFNDADGLRTYRRVCAFGEDAAAPRTRALLAVCAAPQEVADAVPGSIDFFLLERRDGGLHVLKSIRDRPYGREGKPGDVEVVRFGHARSGFLIEAPVPGDEPSLETLSLLEFVEGELVPRAELYREAGSDGNCAEDEECGDIFGYDFYPTIDDSVPTAEAYPLVIHQTGFECGRREVDFMHRLEYDATTGRYPVPDALLQVSCAAAMPPTATRQAPIPQ
jgi:hypothetical protein